MSLVSSVPPRRRFRVRRVSRHCAECGYDLHGLSPDHPCPECGHFCASDIDQIARHTAWCRSVAAGLILLLLLTLQAVCSVLIQPFSNDFVGTTPSLNFPGPKLWAMPLLQRPIGQSPKLPGVTGTRAAMLSLLAIWLITAPCSAPRLAGDQALRAATRWSCSILFGLAFGGLMGSQGLWPAELPPFRLMLVCGVELPAAMLLYLYLRRLAGHVPGLARRQAFDRLAILVPATIAAGAFMLMMQWIFPLENVNRFWRMSLNARTFPFTVSAVYGTVAVTCGVAASAAVASLAVAYLGLAFPYARRLLSGARHHRRQSRNLSERLRAMPFQRIAVVMGIALLLITMVMGNDFVLWISTRSGVAGNLPFVNFPGPKVWAATTLATGGWWATLVTRNQLIFLNLLAVWLITTPPAAPAKRDRLALMARWFTAMFFGATTCLAVTLHRAPGAYGDRYRSELFAAATVLCELPTTLLLYAVLSRLAQRAGQAGLARQFRLLALAIVMLVGASLAAFALSRRFYAMRDSVTVIVLSAGFGAAAMGSATWATAALLRLAGAIVRSPAHAHRQARLTQVRATLREETAPQAGALFD